MYWNKNDKKFLNKIFKKKSIINKMNYKYDVIYSYSKKIDVKCIKIKTLDHLQDCLFFTNFQDQNIWYLINGIKKIDQSWYDENKEYIFCDKNHNIVSIITYDNRNEFENLDKSWTSIFIVPRGSISFYEIEHNNILWIQK